MSSETYPVEILVKQSVNNQVNSMLGNNDVNLKTIFKLSIMEELGQVDKADLENVINKIKQNNKWITADKNESLQKIFTRACEIVSMCIMENKDMYKEAQLETINGYIEKDFDDEIVIETVKKLALDIYNFYNSSI